MSVAVLEKEDRLAAHQSGNNSGVVHAGVYYAPRSLRARLTREGREALAAFASEHRLPYRVCGKVLVATDASELDGLAALEARAKANGLEGVRTIGPEELKEIEPHAEGVRALHVPETAVTDFSAIAGALADEVRAGGGEVHLGTEVTGLAPVASGWRVATAAGSLRAERVIVCAGLRSDRVAALAGGGGGGRQLTLSGGGTRGPPPPAAGGLETPPGGGGGGGGASPRPGGHPAPPPPPPPPWSVLSSTPFPTRRCRSSGSTSRGAWTTRSGSGPARCWLSRARATGCAT